MVRIGLLLTNPDWERQKNELFKFKKSEPNEFPWNKYIPKEDILKRRWRVGKVGSQHGIATDRAVGSFILHAYAKEGFEVDFIKPEEISMARLKSNDLNFLLIYDLLESFHMDPTKKKTRWNEIKACLKNAKNIFPPWHYQEFVCSKSMYYQYFKDHNIDILPTVTVTTAEYKELGHKKAVEKVLDQVQSEGWNKFIAKPEYGQTGLDTKFFTAHPGARFDKHVRLCMKKYPGIVFQKAIKNFGKTKENGELRMLYCGNRYNHSILSCDHFTYSPEAPSDKSKLQKLPIALLKRASRTVLKKLPHIVMPNGQHLPRLITRVDMGFNVEGKVQPFVNEIEYCPSFFSEECAVESTSKLIKDLGRQIVKITKLYIKRRISLRKPSPGHWLKKRRRA
jgi:hypothetical protein